MTQEKYEVTLSEKEWKKKLTNEEYNVLRKSGTERPYTHEYDKLYPKEGYFACKGCNNPLYSYESKFKSGTGWPSFDKSFKGNVVTKFDNKYGWGRTEILCGKCGGHLGHVFDKQRYKNIRSNERQCVNGVSIKYVKNNVKLEEETLMGSNNKSNSQTNNNSSNTCIIL